MSSNPHSLHQAHPLVDPTAPLSGCVRQRDGEPPSSFRVSALPAGPTNHIYRDKLRSMLRTRHGNQPRKASQLRDGGAWIQKRCNAWGEPYPGLNRCLASGVADWFGSSICRPSHSWPRHRGTPAALRGGPSFESFGHCWGMNGSVMGVDGGGPLVSIVNFKEERRGGKSGKSSRRLTGPRPIPEGSGMRASG